VRGSRVRRLRGGWGTGWAAAGRDVARSAAEGAGWARGGSAGGRGRRLWRARHGGGCGWGSGVHAAARTGAWGCVGASTVRRGMRLGQRRPRRRRGLVHGAVSGLSAVRPGWRRVPCGDWGRAADRGVGAARAWAGRRAGCWGRPPRRCAAGGSRGVRRCCARNAFCDRGWHSGARVVGGRVGRPWRERIGEEAWLRRSDRLRSGCRGCCAGFARRCRGAGAGGRNAAGGVPGWRARPAWVARKARIFCRG
jgi:hypothetical protein